MRRGARANVKKEDRVRLLCEGHSGMMRDFSRRCIDRLLNHTTFGPFLSPLHHFFEANVMKEIEKDAMIIDYAVRCFDAGKEAETEEIFSKTKEVDRAFLRKLPVPLDVRYDDFEETRKKRIAVLVRFVTGLLERWDDSSSLAAVIRRTYTERRFVEMVGEMLRLYNLETKMVSSSVPLPAPRIARERLSDSLFSKMEEAAHDAAAEYAKKMYREVPRT